MFGYATAQVYLPTVAENKLFINATKTKHNNDKKHGLVAAVLHDNIPAMNIGDYNMADDSTFVAMNSAHVIGSYAPTFTTCGHGDKKHSGSVKLWTCCDCGESGMVAKSSTSCPNCGHGLCYNCDQYKVKSKN